MATNTRVRQGGRGLGGGGGLFSYKIEVREDSGGVWQEVRNVIDQYSFVWASVVAEKMRHNLAPGVGPGPHPHRTKHDDTGDAMRAVEVRSREAKGGGMTWFAGIFSDGLGASGSRGTPPWKYGFFLEFGWVTKAGTRYQYPWATIAVSETAALRRVHARVSSAKGVFIDG